MTFSIGKKFAAIFALLALLAAGEATFTVWRTHLQRTLRDTRIGQCADIPPNFRSTPSPTNGDGLVFRHGAGVSITVPAMCNALDDTVAASVLDA